MAKRRKGGRTHRRRGEKGDRPGLARAHAAKPAGAVAVNRVMLGLCVAGMGLTAYLTVVKWFGTTPLYCGSESSCDIVQSSRWSTLLGVPLSLWGFLIYALLAMLVWKMRRRRAMWRHAALLAFIGVAVSIYLTAVSILEIRATCAYCLASFAVLTAIFALLCWVRPRRIPALQWRTWLPTAALCAAITLGALHLHYSGVFDPQAGPEKPYLAALAAHLEGSGATFYGAYWCQRCQEQKALFEASAKRLPYVECQPGGPSGPQTVSCAANNIDNYPTWIIDGRRHVGVLKPKALATYSGFRWQEPTR